MSTANKKTIRIRGMHCRSCELLIEESLLKVNGVSKVNVSEKRGEATVFYSDEVADAQLEQAVRSCGYAVGKDTKGWFSKNPKDYSELLIASVVVTALYFVTKGLGLFNVTFNASNNLASLPVVLLVGLTAGFSTCMALVGGLVLGVSARFAEKHPYATALQKFKPHVVFNLGRVAFFALFGGMIGYFGSFLQLGPSAVGSLTVFVGLVMLLLGFQTLSLFPKLEQIKVTLPKGLYRFLGLDTHNQGGYSNRGAFLLGGLTFFLPCGFTQAMQLYAISSGSAATGALTMGLFALGTAPGLLGIGGLTSVIKGAFAKPFFKFVGLTVILLSLFNISNGMNLLGVPLPDLAKVLAKSRARVLDPNVALENGVQVVRMTQNSRGYTPRSFTLAKNVPVKWLITSVDPYSCAASIYSAQLGLRRRLVEGENVIEFTPSEEGTLRFSCSMGMYTGAFNVVDSATGVSGGVRGVADESTSFADRVLQSGSGGSCGMANGGGCGCRK